MASDATYTASGNYVQSVTDSAGNVVTYSYDETKGNLSSVTDPKNSTSAYTYDANTDALTGISKTVEGSVVSNDYSYLNDRLRTITHNGFSYTFSYDVLGNPTTVSAGTQNLVTNSYETRTGKLLESTYGNGHKVAKDYDNLDRAAAYKVWNSATGQYEVKFRYSYDASGNLGYKQDLVNSTSYRYVYDLAERLVKITGTDGSSLANGFDVNNNVSSVTEKGNGTSFTTGYEYDKDNRPLKVTLQNGATGTNTYDSLGRVSVSRITIGAAIFDVSYNYLAGVNGSTTARVGSITNSNGNAISYTYDQNGNIETITEGSKLTKYYYNELNEVIREDNGNLNKSITYTYDAGGNILSKKEYAYTTGVLGTVLSTIPYTYGDAIWKDKLTSYNGKAISYDAIGNPLNYDGWTYAWENGRQLKSLGNGSTSLAFKYDDAGIRTEKTVNGVTTKYTLFGDKVSFETTGSDKIHYSYDASGNLFSMNLNGSEYYYTRNAQGDITGLIDGAKNQVVSYTYDTWGKLLSTTGSLAGTLGVKNPYRYRGYRYDTETGLYYLQSRYYNPDWSRFVNADAIGGSMGDLLSHNMFAYCENNPVNLEDPSGFKPAEGTTTYTKIHEFVIPVKPTSVNRIKTNLANIGKTASRSLMNARIDKYAATAAAKAITSTYKLAPSSMSNAFYKSVSTSQAGDLLKTVTGKIGLSSIVGIAISAKSNISRHGWTSEAAGRTAIDGIAIIIAVGTVVMIPGLPWVMVGGIGILSTMAGNGAKQYKYGGSFWD